MGCCQDKPGITLKANELRPMFKAPSIILHPKSKSLSMEPMKFSIIGDIDRMDVMDEFFQPITSITQIDQRGGTKFLSCGEIKELKQTQLSETIIIDMRSGTYLQSPLKPMQERRSSKNLNSKFIEML